MKRFYQKTSLKRLLASAAVCLLAAHIPAAADDTESQDQLGAKLNSYIKCFNSLDGAAHRSIKRYASWVKDMNAGPTGKEMVVYGLYAINSGEAAACQKSFSEAQGLKPSLVLDGAGAEYIAALAGLSNVVEEMHPYYDRENYKDDKFAKGKKLHTQFVAQMNLFETASKRFALELDAENDRRLEAHMALLEKEQGRKLPYLTMAMMHRAKGLVGLLGKKPGSLDQITARLDAFEKAADEELQFAKNNPEGLPTVWSLFASQIEEFRKASKEYMRRTRDKTPYETGEAMLIKNGAGWMVSGSPEKVVRTYNDLVNRSNGLR